MLEDLIRDARYAARSLRRDLGFTLIALATLGAAIGANAAIFTVVEGILLRPLAYERPDRLVVTRYERSGTIAAGTFSDWQRLSRSFSGLGVEEYWTPTLLGDGPPEQPTAVRITSSMLPLLGVRPAVGRIFLPEEEHDGRNRVIVLSYGFWQTRFAGVADVVGRTLTLDGARYTVIGVMPRGFQFAPFWATGAQFAAPLVLDHRITDRQGSSLRAFGRLRDGVTLDEARAELDAVDARLDGGRREGAQRIALVPLLDVVVGDVRTVLLVLLAAVGFVLLIACANVTHLQLLRASARAREFAVRATMGASRGRLITQSLVENALLSVVAATLGLALAAAGVRALVALAPPQLPRIGDVSLDWTVLAFVLAIATLTALVSGAAPALFLTRTDVQRTLRDGGRSASDGSRRRRVRDMLVVSEFALAVVLLVAAGLVVRSFVAMFAVDAGFDTRNVVTMQVSVRGTEWGAAERRGTFFHDLEARTAALPGVAAVSAINHLPLFGDSWHFPFVIEGRSSGSNDNGPHALFRVVSPGYFGAMRIPILRGRDFASTDLANRSHFVIVNEAMARREWSGEDALGRRLSVDDPAKGAEWFTVIGVTKNSKQASWIADAEEEMFFPYLDPHGDAGDAGRLRLVALLHPTDMTLVVRAASTPLALARSVEAVVHSMSRGAVVTDVMTMDAAVGLQFVAPRFYAVLLGAFGGVGFLLSIVGVYGVISYAAARRTHEIGIRMALGATRGEPFRLVIRHGMTLAFIGAALGLFGAAGLTRYLSTLLFAVQPTDPATFAGVTASLIAVALAACCIPAWRASRVSPIVALRAE